MSDVKQAAERLSDVTATLIDILRGFSSIEGEKALEFAQLINAAGLDDGQWGCAYFRCPECEQARDCNGEEEWGGYCVASCECEHDFTTDDLRISEGWLAALTDKHVFIPPPQTEGERLAWSTADNNAREIHRLNKELTASQSEAIAANQQVLVLAAANERLVERVAELEGEVERLKAELNKDADLSLRLRHGKDRIERERKQESCSHTVSEDKFGSATCFRCGKDFGWYCKISPKHFCEYNDGDEDCIHCGAPEERK